MALITYTLPAFVTDVEGDAREERIPEATTGGVGALRARLIANPGVIPAEFRRRPVDGRRTWDADGTERPFVSPSHLNG